MGARKMRSLASASHSVQAIFSTCCIHTCIRDSDESLCSQTKHCQDRLAVNSHHSVCSHLLLQAERLCAPLSILEPRNGINGRGSIMYVLKTVAHLEQTRNGDAPPPILEPILRPLGVIFPTGAV